MHNKTIIGRDSIIKILDTKVEFPAKIDTGADSSSVWVSDIYLDEENKLHYKLFDKVSEFYTGEEIIKNNYKKSQVRSSNGQSEIRYFVEMELEICDKKITSMVSLSDRSKNTYPMLVGRSTLSGNFLVDVSIEDVYCKTEDEADFRCL